MQIDYIKVPISKEIDEEGGAYIRLVNLLTIALGDSIKEAVKGGYVIGDAVLVTKQFQGLLKSMVEGLERDGMTRQIGDYITIYPKFTGPIDLDKGYDPKVNAIKLGIRILGSEYEIDTKNLTFRDVTPGKLSFAINEASSGEDTDEVDFSKEIKITGSDFPKKDDIRIRVEIPELGLSAFVAPEKFTRSVTVLTIEPNALKEAFATAELASKKATFTVLAGFNNASVTSMIAAGEPKHEPRIVSMIGEMSGKDGVSKGWYDPMTITLENASTEGAKVRRVLYDGKIVDAETGWNMESVKLEVISPTVMKVTFEENVTRETFEIWRTKYRPVTEVQLANGTILSVDMSFEEED